MNKKKKKKKRLNKSDKTKFCIIVTTLFIVSMILFTLNVEIYYFAFNITHGNNLIYAEPVVGFFIIATVILFVVGLLMIGTWYKEAVDMGLSFKDYYSNKIPKAKKHIKRYVVSLLVWFVLITGCFWLSTASCLVANDSAITKCHLFKTDEVFCEYDDIDSVNVYAEYESHIKGKLGGYHVKVKIKDDNFEYILHDEYFDRNFVNIEKFLSKIDKDRITVDCSGYEKINAKAENKDALMRIFNSYKKA